MKEPVFSPRPPKPEDLKHALDSAHEATQELMVALVFFEPSSQKDITKAKNMSQVVARVQTWLRREPYKYSMGETIKVVDLDQAGQNLVRAFEHLESVYSSASFEGPDLPNLMKSIKAATPAIYR